MQTEILSQVAAYLNAAGWNYTVFLSAFTTLSQPAEPFEQTIRRAVGPQAVAVELQPISTTEMVDKIDASLRYAGDSGAGPEPRAVQSEEFKALLARLLAQVRHEAMTATVLQRFRFRDGHPAYPVFWDFAFLMAGPKKSVVLVGSGSD
jgi:hypothetical protein